MPIDTFKQHCQKCQPLLMNLYIYPYWFLGVSILYCLLCLVSNPKENTQKPKIVQRQTNPTVQNSESPKNRELVVTKEHQIILLFNIIEIFIGIYKIHFQSTVLNYLKVIKMVQILVWPVLFQLSDIQIFFRFRLWTHRFYEKIATPLIFWKFHA